MVHRIPNVIQAPRYTRQWPKTKRKTRPPLASFIVFRFYFGLLNK